MKRAHVALIAATALLPLAAAHPAAARRGEVVVTNQTFSSLEISVVVGARETRLGSAPPEFSNTLYFPLSDDGETLRFRARHPGAGEVVHESDTMRGQVGMRVRWTLPANRVEPLDGAGLARAHTRAMPPMGR